MPDSIPHFKTTSETHPRTHAILLEVAEKHLAEVTKNPATYRVNPHHTGFGAAKVTRDETIVRDLQSFFDGLVEAENRARVNYWQRVVDDLKSL